MTNGAHWETVPPLSSAKRKKKKRKLNSTQYQLLSQVYIRCIHETWRGWTWAVPGLRDLRDRWLRSRAERASSNLKTWAPSKKLGENSICNAVKLLSVGAREKYMTALFILHSPFMLESMMASGKWGHSEQCTPIESQCIASLIFHFYADTSITLLWQKVRRKTIISKWISIMYFFWAFCVSERIYVRWENFLLGRDENNSNNNWFNLKYFFSAPLSHDKAAHNCLIPSRMNQIVYLDTSWL